MTVRTRVALLLLLAACASLWAETGSGGEADPAGFRGQEWFSAQAVIFDSIVKHEEERGSKQTIVQKSPFVPFMWFNGTAAGLKAQIIYKFAAGSDADGGFLVFGQYLFEREHAEYEVHAATPATKRQLADDYRKLLEMLEGKYGSAASTRGEDRGLLEGSPSDYMEAVAVGRLAPVSEWGFPATRITLDLGTHETTYGTERFHLKLEYHSTKYLAIVAETEAEDL